MNKRISELVDQVANDMPGVYNIEYESGKKGVEFTEQALEKFAELIVQECARLVEGFQVTVEVGQAHYVDYEASAVLKEHFGVES